MAIKDGVLYADNLGDIVALEINADTVKVLDRLEGIMDFRPETPSFNNVYFECPDPSKGVVTGWYEDVLSKPKCYRQ